MEDNSKKNNMDNKMTDIVIMGESLVEIMRDKVDISLGEIGNFKGPFPSGAPAICASAAAKTGSKVALISGVGKDAFGDFIVNRLDTIGVDTSHVIKDPNGSTGCAFVTYFKDGSRNFIFHMRNTPAVKAKAPLKGDFTGVKFMHIMGCSLMADKKFAQEILKTMALFSNEGARISFDPNIRKELFIDDSVYQVVNEVLKNTSIFLPGTNEILSITKSQTIEEAVEKCFNYPKMQIVLLKNGTHGNQLFVKNEKCRKFDIYPIIQIDATGAGDSFDGAFLSALSRGTSIDRAVKEAAAAGALDAAAFGPMEGDISLKSIDKMIRESEIR